MVNKIILVSFLFLITSTSIFAKSLKQGEVLQDNIHNIYNTNVTISLPPGRWVVNKIKKDRDYSQIDLKNVKDNAYLYLTLPHTILSGDYFRSSGVKKCKNKNENGTKYLVHATGLIRGKLQVSYCIQEVTFTKDGTWLNVSLEAQKVKGSPLIHAFYNVYYEKKFSNINSLDKRQLDEIGKSLIRMMQNNIVGKPGDYRMATQLTNFNNTSSDISSTSNSSSNSLSNSSDMVVCAKAITASGMKWETRSARTDYVKEARSRKLTIENCRSLTGRLDFVVSKKAKEVKSNDSNLKNKLKELKAMFDEGLISQELYETKSNELLKDF